MRTRMVICISTINMEGIRLIVRQFAISAGADNAFFIRISGLNLINAVNAHSPHLVRLGYAGSSHTNA